MEMSSEDDAFKIHNPKTGQITMWQFAKRVYNQENELIYSIFLPSPGSVRAFPRLSGWTAEIFND